MKKGTIKRETTVDKVQKRTRKGEDMGRLKSIESSASGMAKDVRGASQASILSGGQSGRDVERRLRAVTYTQKHVPVVDQENNPLMPTKPSRAIEWIKTGKATGFWKKGIYCVRLNVEPSDRKTQIICVGIDPGSKREGFTVKSAKKTFLNLNAHAVYWVKENVETRRNLRRSRRNRTTPCRKNRQNRSCLKPEFNEHRVPPSTKSRWGFKLRILNWLNKMYPVTDVCVEDIKASSHNKSKRWNTSFSPLETGKWWFYNEIRKSWILTKQLGFQTAAQRESYGLVKTKSKLEEVFSAHCVDSWVLANYVTGGQTAPENTSIYIVKSLRFYRRQLHVQNPAKGNVRKKYGGTMSMGLKRGSFVTHPKYGLSFVGGCSNNRISLHNIEDGKRLCQKAYPLDVKFLTYNSILVNPVRNLENIRLKAKVST